MFKVVCKTVAVFKTERDAKRWAEQEYANAVDLGELYCRGRVSIDIQEPKVIDTSDKKAKKKGGK